MKIIHTSDWHLGHQLYGYDRTDDHLHFFRQLLEIAESERPDALIVSGDIFDVSTPTAACMRLFTDFILRLHEKVPEMMIVVTSGNHDSASRIDVNRNLWRAAGIHVLGTVRRENGEYDFSDNVIEVNGKGYVVAIPYINPAFMGGGKGGTSEMRFFANAEDYVGKINEKNLPVVLMAHMTVNGCDLTGHRTSIIGDVESVPEDTFGSGFDYVALGHIHRPQNISADGRVRYSGTPVAVSFDEEFDHSVSVVEVERGKSPDIREIIISQNRKLVTIPDEGVDFASALKILSKYDPKEKSFVRLNVKQDADLPSDCEEQATQITKGKESYYCTIKYERETKAEVRQIEKLSISEFTEMSVSDLAERFFRSRAIPQDCINTYMQLLAEVEQELSVEQSR